MRKTVWMRNHACVCVCVSAWACVMKCLQTRDTDGQESAYHFNDCTHCATKSLKMQIISQSYFRSKKRKWTQRGSSFLQCPLVCSNHFEIYVFEISSCHMDSYVAESPFNSRSPHFGIGKNIHPGTWENCGQLMAELLLICFLLFLLNVLLLKRAFSSGWCPEEKRKKKLQHGSTKLTALANVFVSHTLSWTFDLVYRTLLCWTNITLCLDNAYTMSMQRWAPKVILRDV